MDGEPDGQRRDTPSAMPLALDIDGPPGQRFTDLVRALPDGAGWLISDPAGAVIIARSEGELLRELILAPSDGTPGTWELECLASGGVSEGAVQALVGLALLACGLGVVGVWVAGPPGLWGLVLGICVAGGLPAVVFAVGRQLLDPGRDRGAEAGLERAVRQAAAGLPGLQVRTLPET